MSAHNRNPLLEAWTTPFEAPPFETIKTEHFAPAFEAGIKAHSAEIDAIATNPETANIRQHNRGSGTSRRRADQAVERVLEPHRQPYKR